jgi:hypothetical protein
VYISGQSVSVGKKRNIIMKKFFFVLGMFFCGFAVFAGNNAPAVSILGDSYSTFRGIIPPGNAIWYPRATNDVKNVENCWWYLVIKAVGGRLEKNESWSGSTVCYTGYKGRDARKSSFVTRSSRLGDPTLILICGATNDSWANVPIGEYKWADWSDKELYTFRPAMAKMLADIKKQYPKAEVFFILNTALKPVINESVHKICQYYDVPCIDLRDIDKQSGHPSAAGMKAMADQVVEAVKK